MPTESETQPEQSQTPPAEPQSDSQPPAQDPQGAGPQDPQDAPQDQGLSKPHIVLEDKVLFPYLQGFRCMIVTVNAAIIYQRPLSWVGPFSFKLDDDHEVKKIDCLGVFSPTMVLAAKRGGPYERIPEQTKKRKSYKIFKDTPQHDLVGAVCHVSLCCGWSFQGLVTRASKYSLTLQCEHVNPKRTEDTKTTGEEQAPERDEDRVLISWANIYLHAVTDLQILHPVGAHPDSVYWLQIFKLPPKERAEIPKPPARSVPFAEMPLEDTKQTRQKKIFQRKYIPPQPKPQSGAQE